MKPRTGAYVLAQVVAIAAVLALISLPLESVSHKEVSSSSTTSEIALSASSCTSTSTIVTSMSPVPSEAQMLSMVNASFSEHLLHLGSRDTFAVTNDFERGAEMVWNGNVQGFGGNYTGLRAINEVFEGFLEPTTSLSIVNETWQLAATTPQTAVVYSDFGIHGHNNVFGNFEAQVLGTDYYAPASGWQISHESWTFKSFAVQNSQEGAPYGPSDASCYG